MKVHGRVVVDLTTVTGKDFEADHKRERMVQEACYSPAGADVVFIVERRGFPPHHGVEYFRKHGNHLGSVTVECSDPDTIRRWVTDLRGEVSL